LNTSLGLWDLLFGQRTSLQIPQKDGTVKEVQVTVRWLEKMVREGKITKMSAGFDHAAQRIDNLLVTQASTAAVSIFLPMADRFSFLTDVQTDDWDFFLTVACIFGSALHLSSTAFSSEDKVRLRGRILTTLDKWNAQGASAFLDCERLFWKTHDSLSRGGHDTTFLNPDSLGTWVAWNLLGRAPQSESELQFTRTVGLLSLDILNAFWRES